MGSFEKFEDMQVWQKSRELTKKIYILSNQGLFRRDFSLRDQIRKACISIMSNIAEGNERKTDKSFANFLSIAKGSASEVRSQLYIALDQGYINKTDFGDALILTNEIGKMLNSLINYLQTGKKLSLRS